jgi:hypothetical protein
MLLLLDASSLSWFAYMTSSILCNRSLKGWYYNHQRLWSGQYEDETDGAATPAAYMQLLSAPPASASYASWVPDGKLHCSLYDIILFKHIAQ